MKDWEIGNRLRSIDGYMIRCSGVSKFLQSSISKRVLRPYKSARLDLRQAALEGARQAGVGAPGGARCVPIKWIVYDKWILYDLNGSCW